MSFVQIHFWFVCVLKLEKRSILFTGPPTITLKEHQFVSINILVKKEIFKSPILEVIFPPQYISPNVFLAKHAASGFYGIFF
jgi:hypothetical protein